MSDEILIKMGVDGSAIGRGLQALDGQFNTFGQKISGYISGALAPLAIGAAAGSLGAWAKGVFAYAKQLEVLSQNTGVSTDTLQFFGKAARRAGVDTDDAQNALAKLSAKIGEARSGNAEATASFAKWGIALSDSAGHAKTVDQILGEVTKRNGEFGDAAEAAAFRMDLFSKAGVKMGAVLENFGTMAKDKNKILSEGDLAKLESAEKTLAHMANHSKAFGGKILAGLATFVGLVDPNAQINAGLARLDARGGTATAAADPKLAKEILDATAELKKAQGEADYKSTNDAGKLVVLLQREHDLRQQIDAAADGTVAKLKLQKDLVEATGTKEELLHRLAEKRAAAEKTAADHLREQRKLTTQIGEAQTQLADLKQKRALAGNLNPTLADLAGAGQWWGGPDYMAQAREALRNSPYRAEADRAQFLAADEFAARGLGNTDRAEADKAERLGIQKRLGDLGVTTPDETLRSIDEATQKTEAHLAELRDLLRSGNLTVQPRNSP